MRSKKENGPLGSHAGFMSNEILADQRNGGLQVQTARARSISPRPCIAVRRQNRAQLRLAPSSLQVGPAGDADKHASAPPPRRRRHPTFPGLRFAPGAGTCGAPPRTAGISPRRETAPGRVIIATSREDYCCVFDKNAVWQIVAGRKPGDAATLPLRDISRIACVARRASSQVDRAGARQGFALKFTTRAIRRTDLTRESDQHAAECISTASHARHESVEAASAAFL